MKKLLACFLAAILLATTVASTTKVEAATKEGISAVAYLDYLSFIEMPSFGRSVTTWSSGWYSNMSEEEKLARLIYACVEGEEQDAICFVSMLWNRMNTNTGNFASVNTLVQVIQQSGQFPMLTGNSTYTLNARTPDRNSDRWDLAVYMACVLCAIVSESGTPAIMWPSREMPTGYIGQLYYASYSDFYSLAHTTGGVSYMNDWVITNIMIPTLGTQISADFAKNAYVNEDEDTGGSMLDNPVNFYFNRSN